MVAIKVKRQTLTGYSYFWRIVQSGTYKKVINTFGEIKIRLENLISDEDLKAFDFIELWVNDVRLDTGYVTRTTVFREYIDVVISTEEIKLLNVLTPDSYTLNVTGLSLESITDFCTKKFTQIRASDKHILNDYVKSVEDEIDNTRFVFEDNIYTQTYQYNASHRYALQLLEVIDGVGSITDPNTAGELIYDKIYRLQLHENYREGTDLSTLDNVKAGEIRNLIMSGGSSPLLLKLFYASGTTSDPIEISGYKVTTNYTDSVKYAEIVGGAGYYVDLYVDSSEADYEDVNQALTSVDFYNSTETPITHSVFVEHAGTAFNSFKGWARVFVPISDYNFTNAKIERIRWSERYTGNDYNYKYVNNYVRFIVDRAKTGIYYTSAETNGNYDASTLPTDPTSVPYFRFTPATETTEQAGYLIDEDFTSSEDLYFLFELDPTRFDSSGFSSDERFNLPSEAFETSMIKAFEIIVSEKNISSYTIENSVKDISTDVEADFTTIYDVMRKAVEDKQAYFYVQDDVLVVKDKASITNTEHFLAENMNCDINSIDINSDGYANITKITGVSGSSFLNKPLSIDVINSFDGDVIFGGVRKERIITTNTRSSYRLERDKDDIALENTTEVASANIVIDQDSDNIVKVGDSVDLRLIMKNKSYKLFVEEVSYSFEGNDFKAKINTSNTKKLT